MCFIILSLKIQFLIFNYETFLPACLMSICESETAPPHLNDIWNGIKIWRNSKESRVTKKVEFLIYKSDFFISTSKDFPPYCLRLKIDTCRSLQSIILKCNPRRYPKLCIALFRSVGAFTTQPACSYSAVAIEQGRKYKVVKKWIIPSDNVNAMP